MTTLELGKKYVAMCKDNQQAQILETLFSKDIVSVEAGAPNGGDPTAKGIDAVRAKSKWWGENHTVHKAEHFGPYPNGNRFCVRFVFDITQKSSGHRMTMDEVGLFTVENDKITREEFFYSMGG